MTADPLLRHLEDLCRQADARSVWRYSGFLSPAEQEDFRRFSSFPADFLRFWGGYETAERCLLGAGSEALFDLPPSWPICVVRVSPVSRKFAEDLTHRDFLGAILALGLERSLIGDLLVRNREAWVFCLESAAELLTSSLREVRRTAVIAQMDSLTAPDLSPRLEPVSLNVASERLDAVVAALSGLSRSHSAELFATGRVLVNSRRCEDGSAKLKPGDVLSVRGFGKARYDGIDRTSRKGRLFISLQKYV